jgi:hypothetical protein
MKLAKFEFVKPEAVDWAERIQTSEAGTAKTGEIILNPETLGLDFEKMEVFVPDTSKYVGKPRGEVAQAIVKEYGKDYYIPGFEYQQWLSENPSKVPSTMKDENYYYTFGSSFGGSGGRVRVPYGSWNGKKWFRSDRWVGSGWSDVERVVLLLR